MKKNLTKIWLLLPLLMMGNLFAACSGSDGGESNPPTEHKMTATIKTAAPYTELGFKDDVAHMFNNDANYSLLGTLLVYDQSGKLKYTAEKTFRDLSNITIEAPNMAEGSYIAIYYQADIHHGKTSWTLENKQDISTVQVSCNKANTISPCSSLSVATGTFHVDEEGDAQLTLTPKTTGSIVSMQVVRSEAIKDNILSIDLQEYAYGIRLNPVLSDADRYIYGSEDVRLNFLFGTEDRYDAFVLTESSVTYSSQLAAYHDNGNNRWDWDADLTSRLDITLKRGKTYIYYFDSTKSSDNFFFGLFSDFPTWKNSH